MDEERYATEGALFFCNVMDHMECLIGLPKDAYIELMAFGHPFQILVSRGHTLYHPSSNPIFDQNSVTRYHGNSRKIMLIHITIQITSNP